MNSITISNLDENIKTQLEYHASLHGITPEDEAKNIIIQTLSAQNYLTTKEQHLARVRAIRDKNAHLQGTDSVDLIREDRDR
jgi:plasmid stability protein